ncbi:MAG: hypothetical protein WD749_02335 [Phycisphaerales bacterium]
MNLPVTIALLGWIPVVFGLFVLLPARRAVVVSFVTGALFLPVGGFSLPGLPDYTRATATPMLCLAAVFLFDGTRLVRFRPSLLDLPMLAFCTVPLASSLTSFGIGPKGLYDGASAVVHSTIVWGVPYFIGRLYLDDLAAHKGLAVGMLVGALIYVPLCLFEIRMSPQLHYMLYGYHPHSFVQHMRQDGYRPMVFMGHGLAVGLWMAVCSLIGVWLWWTGAVRTLLNVPLRFSVPVLLVTLVLCKAIGVLLILAVAGGALFAAKWLRMRTALAVLALVPLLYIADRMAGSPATRQFIAVAAAISPDRASSLETRIVNEEALAARALQRPVFGWAGWGDSRVKDEEGNDVSITDGLWVIFLGINGVVGLGALLGWHLLPPLAVIRRVAPGGLGSAAAAPALALSVVLLMVAIDALPNSPHNPVYTMISGGLVSLSVALRRPRPVTIERTAVQRGRAGAPALE